ncbi:hypothetical protein MBM09_15175 [Flaviramulus sp. BrNp1-15]|uniref:hypothetical protein n=1 Tax=Flaviramulus sp. BrNp1-15 TaxID=2916754 RepID=UPI001EE81494|nr:hypothetical protein [Flaviramulus sp. BrNp1-15]ULC59235.1 hypothetical protein MBM09_15175 [Flaviramulus sp. BrNp1-15]
MQNKRLLIIIVFATVLLVIPSIAMQFTEEVQWTLTDFISAGAMLYGTGLFYEFIITKIKKRKYRIFLTLAITIVLLLIWLELAVGIFGTPISGS